MTGWNSGILKRWCHLVDQSRVDKRIQWIKLNRRTKATARLRHEKTPSTTYPEDLQIPRREFAFEGRPSMCNSVKFKWDWKNIGVPKFLYMRQSPIKRSRGKEIHTLMNKKGGTVRGP